MPSLERLDKAASSQAKNRQLKVMLTVTAPHERVLFIIALACIAIAFAWLFFGRVENIVRIDGLLVKAGSRHEATSLEPGHLIEFTRKKGDLVVSGDSLARQSVPELDRELSELENRLAFHEEEARHNHAISRAEQQHLETLRATIFQLEAQRAVRENIVANIAGEIMAWQSEVGEFLTAGTAVATIREIPESRDGELQAHMRVNAEIARHLRMGMLSTVEVSIPGQDVMHLPGEIMSVAPGPLPNWLAALMPDADGAYYRIDIKVLQQANNPIPNATACRIRIIVHESSPLELFFPSLFND